MFPVATFIYWTEPVSIETATVLDRVMARFKAILSDIDGTLTDSEDVHRDGFVAINRQLGVEFSPEEIEGGVGVALKDKYEELKLI